MARIDLRAIFLYVVYRLADELSHDRVNLAVTDDVDLTVADNLSCLVGVNHYILEAFVMKE